MGKLLKNSYGEYNYHFNWIDENGHTCGFNNVWASNKRKAMKIAKQMERKAYWFKWDEKSQTYVDVPEGTEKSHRNKGMYVDVKSMRRANAELRSAMDKLGHMMTC
jgi:hypothetical protein